MDFNEYQDEAHKTAQYPKLNIATRQGNHDDNCTVPSNTPVPWVYATLGLVGEAGEVAEKVKKIVRNKQGALADTDKVELAKELGDVLWYVAELASCLDLNLDDIARLNLTKLQDRVDRDKICCEGDNR